MEITQTQNADTCQLDISGEMSIYEAMELKERLLGALENSRNLEINLSQVSEIDTVGFQVLVLVKREADQANKTFHLLTHSEATLDVIDTYHMADFFGDAMVMPAGNS